MKGTEVIKQLSQYDLSEEQLQIFKSHTFNMISANTKGKSEFDAMAKLISACDLTEGQIKILNTLSYSLVIEALIREGKSDFVAIMKAFLAHPLDEIQVKAFASAGISVLMDNLIDKGKCDIDTVMKVISEHHLDGNQVKVLGSFLVCNLVETGKYDFKTAVQIVSEYHLDDNMAAVVKEDATKFLTMVEFDECGLKDILSSLEKYNQPVEKPKVVKSTVEAKVDADVKKSSEVAEQLLKYNLSEEQVKILDDITSFRLLKLAKGKSDFDSMVKTVLDHNLDDAQIKILSSYAIGSIVEGGKVGFDEVVKSISMHHLDDSQSKVLGSYVIIRVIKEGISNFDDALKAISSHHLSDSQVASFNDDYGHYYTLLSNGSSLEKVLTNLEKYDQPTQPWGAWFWEKLGYTDEVKVVETKVATDIIPEVNSELITPTEGQGE